ncbi:MAG: hypothetical protein R6X02_25415 [Enhygromyxa sp.]
MELDEPIAMLALPAAHSMDTHWFAVDELGHVAMFAAGEAGLVPDAAAQRWPTGSLLETSLLPMLPEVDAAALSYEAADLFAAPPSGWVARLLGTSLLDAPPRFEQSLHGVLLQLRPVAGLRERLPEHGLHLLPSREGEYAWGHLDSPALRELWGEGWIVRAALGHNLEPTRMGMFFFEHEHEHEHEHWSEAPDVYRRFGEPRVPLRVHALPIALRRRLAAARFEGVDFRSSETLRAGRASRANPAEQSG